MSTRRNFQGLFIIAGIALVIVGLNNSYPIIIAGGAMIALGLLDRFLGGASQ